ncbi:MAG: MerR family transcriptional regulator [Steroidobacteraceae bacterium]
MSGSGRERFTLGRLASQVGLARSSILHYESIGLLVPGGRSAAGYRLYGGAELERLREQQRLLARLLAIPGFRNSHRHCDKAAWVALLRRAGFSESDMRRWHVEFERDDPQGHAAFLESLGIGRREAATIRRWSKGHGASQSPMPRRH